MRRRMCTFVLLGTFISLVLTPGFFQSAYAATTHMQHVTKPMGSWVNCSGYGCDNVYAYPEPNGNTNYDTTCGNTGWGIGWFRGEPRWSEMYYSSACNTNWAYITSPNGKPLDYIYLRRATPPAGSNCNVSFCIPSGHDTLLSCNLANRNCPGGFPFDQIDRDYIPGGATTWWTNMLYAPSPIEAQICVVPSGSSEYCSYWH